MTRCLADEFPPSQLSQWTTKILSVMKSIQCYSSTGVHRAVMNSSCNKENIWYKTPTLLFARTIVTMCLLPPTNSVVAFAQHRPRGWSTISEIGDIPDCVSFVLFEACHFNFNSARQCFVWDLMECRKMQHDLCVLNLQVWNSALKLETVASDNHRNHSFCIVYSQDYFCDNTSRRVDMKT